MLSAVIVPDSEADALRNVGDQICTDLGKPTSTVFHWAQNIKQHSQRKHVSRLIAASPATISNVLVLKQAMMGSGTHLSDPAAMYNYAIRRLLERVTWFVRDHGGEPDDHVRAHSAHLHTKPPPRTRRSLSAAGSRESPGVRLPGRWRSGAANEHRVGACGRVLPHSVARPRKTSGKTAP